MYLSFVLFPYLTFFNLYSFNAVPFSLEKYKIKTFYTSSGDISIKSDGENIYFIQK